MILFAPLVLLAILPASLQQNGPGFANPNNPCSAANLKAELYHHPYPGDPSRYMQCTEWGNYHVMSCYPGTWEQATLTCVNGDLDDAFNDQTNPKPNIGIPNLVPQNGNPALWSGYQGNNQWDAGSQLQNARGNVQPFNGMQEVVSNNGNYQQAMNAPNAYSGQKGSYYTVAPPAIPTKSWNNTPKGTYATQSPTKSWTYTAAPTSRGYNPTAAPTAQTSWYNTPKGYNPTVVPTSNGQKGLYQPGQKGSYNTPAPPTSGKSHGKSQPQGKSGQEWAKTVDSKSSYGGATLNPCSDAATEYVTNPTNPFKYYQCINGVAEERDCPTDHVWIQRDKQCKSLQPINSHYQNPCLGKTKFLPYPGDASKYIECIGWYRQEIRECLPGQIWDQARQTCIVFGTQQPPATQAPWQPSPQTPRPSQPGYVKGQITLRPGSNGIPSNLCQNSATYYHPYAMDPNMYIQCDEFGSMYLRFCGPGARWNDDVKTCTGNSSSIDAKGDTNNAGYGNNNQMTNNIQGGQFGKTNTADKTPEPFYCPEGMEWVASRTQCITAVGTNAAPSPSRCPEGMLWIDTIQGCIDITPGVSITDQAIPIQCPRYFIYDQETGHCKGEFVVEQQQMAAPSCEQNYFWDSQIEMCIKRGNTPVINDVPRKDSNSAIYTMHGPSLRVASGVPANGIANGQQYETNGQRYPINNVNSGQNNQGYGDKNFQNNDNSLVLTDMNGNPVHTNAHQGQTVDNTDFIPVTVDKNPCISGDEELYHPYPSDPRYFIQCDAFGSMFVHPCGYSLVWDQELKTCVPWSVMLSAPAGSMGGAAKEGNEKIDNPCIDSDSTFYDFPYNKYMYIMCVGPQPYVMPCPVGLKWNNDVTTCLKQSKFEDNDGNDDDDENLYG